MHPGLELAYVLNTLGQSPLFVLRDSHLATLDQSLAILKAVSINERPTWGSGGWYDDFCLLHVGLKDAGCRPC